MISDNSQYAGTAARLLGMRLSATSYDHTTDTVERWVLERHHGYICVCCVHMIMEGYEDSRLREAVNNADLVTTDGMPLVWYLRRHGFPNQTRVYGPTLMPTLIARAEALGWRVGLYGGDQDTLDRLVAKLHKDFPKLDLAYHWSPPFRTLTEEEIGQVRDDLRSAGVQLLFVGLGCPKQEFWMAEQAAHLPLIMVGVGAAFPFLAGTSPQAPSTLQKMGLEWLFRLAAEPRRLWKRYSTTVPKFIFLMLFPRFQKPAQRLD